MRKTVTQEIDGVTYTCQQMDAMRGFELGARVAAMLGANGMRLVFMSHDKKVDFAKRIGADMGTAGSILNEQIFDALMENMNAVDGKGNRLLTAEFAVDLLAGMSADKVEIGADVPVSGPVAPHFKDHFAGRYKHLLEVLLLSIRTNFLNPT